MVLEAINMEILAKNIKKSIGNKEILQQINLDVKTKNFWE